jgi:hypothetical protein
MGRGPEAGVGRSAAPRPFFFFPIRFPFCFSFVVFAKQTKNGLKQLLKLANCFPSVC